MQLRDLQIEQAEWADRNFGPRHFTEPLMGLTEELGELNHHLLKQVQGIRGSFAEHEAGARDAVGDLVVFLSDLCNLRGWDLQEVVDETWAEVKRRDWQKDRKNGVHATEAIQNER